MWIDDVIHINSEIKSNGGNVYIFANKVHISAPVDTRVHFNVGREYWEQFLHENRRSFASELGGWITRTYALDAFDQLYFWRDMWNKDKKIYEYSHFTAPKGGVTAVYVPKLGKYEFPKAIPLNEDNL